jgi:hypothetical protein
MLPAGDKGENISLKEYLQGAVEKVVNSKSAEEPYKWHVNTFTGKIWRRERHHGH